MFRHILICIVILFAVTCHMFQHKEHLVGFGQSRTYATEIAKYTPRTTTEKIHTPKNFIDSKIVKLNGMLYRVFL